MTKLVKAEFETPNFTFEAYGQDKDEALRLLKKAWSVHCAQSGADENYLNEYQDDITYTDIVAGSVFRDGHKLSI